jgi:hypothetical protein
MTRFTPIPELPQTDIDPWLVTYLSAIQENVELLTGFRREPGAASQALVKSSVTTPLPPAQNMTVVSTAAGGLSIPTGSGVIQVPSLAAYSQTLTDLQTLANDVASLHSSLSALIAQLKG